MVRKLGTVAMAVMVLILARGTSWALSRPATTPTLTEAHPKVTPTAVTGAAGYLWMLGTYPCATGTCRVLMRSTDGGKTFVRVGTPPVGTYGIEFANRQDGYTYIADLQDDQSSLYWTDDGGKSWRLAFARFRGASSSQMGVPTCSSRELLSQRSVQVNRTRLIPGDER